MGLSAEQLRLIDELSKEALALAPERRAGFLLERCPDDGEVRSEVLHLLDAAHDMDESFLGAAPRLPTLEGAGAPAGSSFTIGAIAGYEILEKVGEGGFGAVFLAEQHRPVRRRVAVKVIKPGMDSEAVIARFEAERQALAVMDHPCIAKVFDAGATDRSLPYFVMELVGGQPINRFCDDARMLLDARVRLFIRVCEAVQHAHSKGIIHRDLKPSNILVNRDAEGHAAPKIIDFGIAKALEPGLSEHTVFTHQGQMIGTPAYMSPEQAAMSAVDIDTRADVYSLGVVLYELLTGFLPFDPATLGHLPAVEIQRRLLEVEPPIPSARLAGASRLGEASETDATSEPRYSAADAADKRCTSISALRRALSRDLDWIVTKCLEKDRERRYDTAIALAEDLRRYLADEPVLARPPGPLYHLSKHVKRNRTLIVTSAIVVVAILAGLGVAANGYLEARRQSDVADGARQLAAEVFSYDPGADESTEDAASRFVSRIAQIFGDDHAAIGSFLSGLGANLRASGRTDEAIPILERAVVSQREALGAEHPAVASTLHELGQAYVEQRRLEDAERALTAALKIRRDTLGPRHYEVGETCFALVEMIRTMKDPIASRSERDAYYAEGVEAFRSSYGPHDPRTVRWMCSYASWLYSIGERGRAAPMLAEAVALGRENRKIIGDSWIQALQLLIHVHSDAKDPRAARAAVEEFVAAAPEFYASGAGLARQIGVNALYLQEAGDAEGAAKFYRVALPLAQRNLPPDDNTRLMIAQGLLMIIAQNPDADPQEIQSLQREIDRTRSASSR